MNLAVSAVAPAADDEAPRPTASDEPRLSKMAHPGRCRSSPCLFSMLHTVPDEPSRRRLVRSQRPGWASSSSSIGWAKAMPTMAALVAFSRAASSQNSAALKRVEGRLATVPPVVRDIMPVNWEVPCISGAAAMVTPGSVAAARGPASSFVASGGTSVTRLPPAPSTKNRSS